MSARSGLFDAAIVALGFLLVLSGVWAMVASRTYVSISRSGQTPPPGSRSRPHSLRWPWSASSWSCVPSLSVCPNTTLGTGGR